MGKAFGIKIHTDCLSLRYIPNDMENYSQQSAEIYSSKYNHCGPGANVFLRDAGKALPNEIVNLEIDLENIEKHPIENGVLQSILSRTTALRTLRISMDYPDADLASTIQKDLLQALAIPEDNHTYQMHLPNLQSLEIINFDFAGDETGLAFDELMCCFRMRKKLGLMVHVHGFYNVSDEAIGKLRATFGHDSYTNPDNHGNFQKVNKEEERKRAFRETEEETRRIAHSLRQIDFPRGNNNLSAMVQQVAFNYLNQLDVPLP